MYDDVTMIMATLTLHLHATSSTPKTRRHRTSMTQAFASQYTLLIDYNRASSTVRRSLSPTYKKHNKNNRKQVVDTSGDNKKIHQKPHPP